MATHKLYSKQKAAAKSRKRAFRYDIFPTQLRTQILNVIDHVVGGGSFFDRNAAVEIYEEVERVLRHEYAVSSLVPYDNSKPLSDLLTGATVRSFFLKAPTDNCLDVVQVTLNVTKRVLDEGKYLPKYSKMTLADGVLEINERFKEHGVGFQYADGQIVRIVSEFAHANMVSPAIKLLSQSYLKGANQEFMSAQEHYRHSRYKECLNDCLKTFESTMKAICHKQGWAYNQNDTAKKLITICEENKLFPVFLESHLAGLRATLESGVPTARNKTSGHGQGVDTITVSEEFATYVLNLTATTILFFTTSEQKIKSK